MAEGGHYYNEHDDRAGAPYRGRKGQGSHRARSYGEGPRRDRTRGGHQANYTGPGPRSRLDDMDADVTMSDNSQDGTSQHRRGGRGGGGYKGDGGGGGRGGSGAKQTCGAETLILVFQIPHGRKYDKKWLMTALQNICSVPFNPVNVSSCPPTSFFKVCPSGVGWSARMEQQAGWGFPAQTETLSLSQCMGKRFDGSQQALDLNTLRTDPELVSQNIDVILNRKTTMEAVIKIIEKEIPELVSLNLSNNRIQKLDDLSNLVGKVPNLKTLNLSNNELKSDRELDKIKGLKLGELWLEKNPLSNSFKDQASYIRSVTPQTDGQDLPPPIVFDVETPTVIPACKGSCFGSDEIKAIILRFLQQYYSIYDSGDRQSLLDAYHDGASLSMMTPYSTQNPSRSSLGEYHKDSRNLKRVKDTTLRYRLLKHTRLNVVAFLNELPKTQHDTASFNVDVNTYTVLTTCLFSSVTVEGKSRDSTMAFSRVFVTVPAGNSGLCIVNDQLFIRMATTEEIRKAFVAPAPTPSSSPVPTLTAPQQEMLSAFSLESGMNFEWSQKCLQDNEWDFHKAAGIFTKLKMDGKIPDVAFIK
uniref:Nuclear RNA export factor 1a n=1 Tax=Gadus morhua TaxID=8049 RepID=A0A8C5CR28_GADMO